MKKRLLSLLLCLAVLMGGMVFAPAAKAAAGGASAVIVDNTDTQHTAKNGTWNVGTSKNGFYGENYEASPDGNAESRFEWKPELPKAGWYHLYLSLIHI